jgi:hypothetical protein
MCDYSLHSVRSRPAKVGDKLVSTKFTNSITRGFASIEDTSVAVCLLPGTEIAFDNEVAHVRGWGLLPDRKLPEKVARVRQVDMHRQDVHHDALEFPSGRILLVNDLCEGQRATVLQLPAAPRVTTEQTAKEDERFPVS